MNKEKIVEQVQQLKQALVEIEKRLSASDVPAAVLEDFKMAVDHTRMTVWALLSANPTAQYEVSEQIARFRAKRAAEMFKHIRSDIDTNELTIDSPELQEFYAALKETVERVERFYKSGS